MHSEYLITIVVVLVASLHNHDWPDICAQASKGEN